jgi:hypothetical protein
LGPRRARDGVYALPVPLKPQFEIFVGIGDQTNSPKLSPNRNWVKTLLSLEIELDQVFQGNRGPAFQLRSNPTELRLHTVWEAVFQPLDCCMQEVSQIKTREGVAEGTGGYVSKPPGHYEAETAFFPVAQLNRLVRPQYMVILGTCPEDVRFKIQAGTPA